MNVPEPGGIAHFKRLVLALADVARRLTIYTLTALLAALLYAVATGLAWALFGAIADARVAPFIGMLTVAAAFRPLLGGLSRHIDRLFPRPHAGALRLLAQFAKHASTHEAALARALFDCIHESFGSCWLRLELAERPVHFFGTLPPWPSSAPPLVLTLVAGDQQQGALHFGPRHDGRDYEPAERELLAVLATHAAAAFENGRLREERLSLRVREGLADVLARDRRELLMQIVHDVRSDLMTIAVAAELGRNDPTDAKPHQFAARSVQRIEAFLDEKLRLAEQGSRNEPGRVLSALAGAKLALANQLSLKDQRLELSSPSEEIDLPLSAVEFEQVVVNLVTNASKFSPEGSVVRCTAWQEGSKLRLWVEDQGPGIPESLLAELGSGRRAHPEIPGLGLGLRNVLTILAKVNGYVAWRNAARGAVVEVVVPLEQPTL
jgi:signal transduction histidine kinase